MVLKYLWIYLDIQQHYLKLQELDKISCKISENVDVISSMIYPSHWTSYFGIAKPDLEPYRLVQEYAKVENAKLAELENTTCVTSMATRFYCFVFRRRELSKYGKEEVEAQIKALSEAGINEYLLWNAGNKYSKGVDYTP